MKSILTTILVCATILSVFSCASAPTKPLAPGEMRLLRIQVPVREDVGVNLLFEVKVTFEAEGKPEIKRACFSWSGDGPYCFKVGDITYGSPGSFSVWIRKDNLGPYLLECYAHYVLNKEMRTTNAVSTPITVTPK